MGLFNNLFSGTKELSKLANSVANVIRFLDVYEEDNDITYLITAAWMCKVGVTDRIEKNGWKPTYIVYVTINGHLTKMTMMEVYMNTIYRLKNKANAYWDSDLAIVIDNILDGKQDFYKVDAQIPQEVREVIL